MTKRVTTTRAADDDIRDIATYIAIDSPEAARRFANELWAAFERIAERPDVGQALPEFAVPIRRMPVSRRFRRYLIFYRSLDAAAIEIVCVLHGARDLTRLMADLK